MRKLKLLNCFYFFILVVIIYMLTVFYFEGNHVYSFFVFQICFALIVYFFEKFKSKFDSLFFQFSFSVFCLIVSIFIQEFDYSWTYIVFTPLSYYLVLRYKKGSLKIKVFSLIVLLLMNYIVGFHLFTSVFNLKLEKEKVKEIADVKNSLKEIEFYDKNGKLITFPEGIVVLDFWTNFCGECFKKFPDFNKLSKLDKYNNENIQFYFVNVLYGDNETIETNLKRFHRFLPTNENVIFVKDNQKLEEKLKIDAYPEVLIILDGKVVHKSIGIYEKDLINTTLEEVIDVLHFNYL